MPIPDVLMKILSAPPFCDNFRIAGHHGYPLLKYSPGRTSQQP